MQLSRNNALTLQTRGNNITNLPVGGQPVDGVHMPARITERGRVFSSVGVEDARPVRVSSAPSGVHDDHCMFGYAPVDQFPCCDIVQRNLVVRVCLRITGYVDDNTGSNQSIGWNLVNSRMTSEEVCWSVQMSSTMFRSAEPIAL